MHAPSRSEGSPFRGQSATAGAAGRILLAFALIAVGVALTPERAAAAQTLTVVVEGPGSITSDPAGIDCPPDCDASLSGEVTLTAHPADGSAISGWAGCPPIEVGDIPDTCVVTMDSAREVTAILVDPVAFTVLDDVVVGPQGSGFGSRKVASGDKVYAVYYPPGLNEEQLQLFVTNGQPGSGRYIEVNTTGGGCAAYSDVSGCSWVSEFNIQPFGEDSLIFAATDGHEPANFGLRLFVTDGTDQGTHPLQPEGSSSPCAGYYGVSAGITGRNNHFHQRVSLQGAADGAAFFGVEIEDGNCAPLPTRGSAFPGPRVPWYVSATTGEVTSLARGFETEVPGGMAELSQALGLSGDRVFAGLADCSSACDAENEGRDLYWVDLDAGEEDPGYAWQLVGGEGLVPDQNLGLMNDVRLIASPSGFFFQTVFPDPDNSYVDEYANPIICDARYAYFTTGEDLEVVEKYPSPPAEEGGPCSSRFAGGINEGIAVGDAYYFYAPKDSTDPYEGLELRRFSGGTTVGIQVCGDDSLYDDYGVYELQNPKLAALGDSVYFACSTPDPGNDFHENYDAGLWRVDAGSTEAVQIWEPEMKVLECPHSGGSSSSSSSSSSSEGGPRLFQGSLDQVVAFGGAIYFTGADTTMFDPDDLATCDERRGELYVYTGSGEPQPIPFNPEGPSQPGSLFGRPDDLVAWANDGIHGVEPWTGDIVPMADLALAVSGPGTVSAAAYAGLPLSRIDDCAATCAYPFPVGSSAVLTAVPGGGATFVGWSSNCGALDPDADGNPRCLVRMSSPRTVGAVFAGPGDALAAGASGPAEAGPGGLIPYSVVVGNVTGTSITDAVLDVTLTAGTLDLGLTPWCSSSGGGAYTCRLASISGGTAKALRLFATAPDGGAVGATFEVSSATRVDTYTDDDSAEVSTTVAPDLLAATLVSYPSRVPSGGLLTYRVDVRDIGDDVAEDVELHIGFNHLGMTDAAFGEGCDEDPMPDAGYSVTVTCPVGGLEPGDRRTVEVSAPSPSTQTDIPLAATFWLEYASESPGILANDLAGPVSTLVLAAVAGDRLTQESDAPLGSSQTIGTSSPGGTTSWDPMGIDVDLPSGFAGLFASSEVRESPTPEPELMSMDMPTLARKERGSGGAGSRRMFTCEPPDPIYLAGCWAFDTAIDETLGGAPVPVLLTLTFDDTGFVHAATGRKLGIRRVALYLQLSGVGAFAKVGRCPRSVTVTSYRTYGGSACLIGQRVDANGDYAFVVVASRGGSWKTGR